jgi:hypothetical protein
MKFTERSLKFTMLALALTMGATSCKQNPNQNSQAQSAQPEQSAQTAQPATSDQGGPAAANMAPVAQPEAAPQQQAPDQEYSEAAYNPAPAEYAPDPPPPLPEYDQPPIPDEGYIWTPGYWSWADGGYYWVPGAWVAPPYAGALWTPGYWGYFNGRYGFCHGYWGRYIGYYGGVNYGYGYDGRGYQGGYWQGDRFDYNRSANNFGNTRVENVYDRRVENYTRDNRVSYNGGPQGVQARPTPAEVAAYRAPHAPPMASQVQLAKASASNRAQFASVNHGKPATMVSSKPIPAQRGIKPAPVMQPMTKNERGPAAAESKPEMNKPAARVETPTRPPMQPETRTAPNRAEPNRAEPNKPFTETRPAPQHAAPPSRPTTEARTTPAPRPAPESRAAPPPRPAPETRAAPPPRPVPESRPAPPAQHAPEAHNAPMARPAPAAHSAPPHEQNRPEGKQENQKE